MSSRPDVAGDPEAHWRPAPRSRASRLLRGVLGAAALLVAVALGAAIGAWLAFTKLAAPGPGGPGGSPSTLAGSSKKPPEPELTARLLAQNVTLKNGTLSWYSQQGMAGVHLSPGLTYDERSQELVVAKPGRYRVCLYLELSHVLPTSRDSGKVLLALHLEPPQVGGTAQTLAVELTPYSSVSVQDSCCHLLQVPDDQRLRVRLSVRLSVYLSTEGSKYQAWQLAQPATHPATKLELFRVAAEVPD